MNKSNYQKKKKNFLKYLVKKYLKTYSDETPADIYERMNMHKTAFYSYLREGKNSSPEVWSTWREGLRMSEEAFFLEVREFFK